MKQCDVYMKEYEKQIEEEKNRSIQQDKYVKKQEEVMFATIHKVGVGWMDEWMIDGSVFSYEVL